MLDALGDGPCGDVEAEADLDAWLRRIAAHETVRTDRAGALVAAAMLGKRVLCVGGSELGVDSIARYAFADRPVELIEHEPPALPRPPPPLDPEFGQTLARFRGAITTPPAPSEVRVTSVVLTSGRPGYLARALDSIERSGVAVRTLVIDNNSAPVAAHAVAAVCQGRERTELRRSERNLGCGGGRRRGVELADTELVLFLDDDAELMPGALEHLLSELDRHQEAGAVTGTVVHYDGIVMHSGGPVDVSDEIVTFGLLGTNTPLASVDLPPSGPSGWAPHTAVLVRRTLLEQHPIDPTIGAYFEDNEWCYRVSKTRPASFRRSREAVVVHHSKRTFEATPDFASRSRMVELLGSYARFYELHGRLLGPWLFDHVPELRADDGSCDLAAARILMELVSARGVDWVFMTWMNGDLGGLLAANRRLVRLHVVEAALAREQAEVAHHKRVAEREREEALRLSQELASMRMRAAGDASTIAALNARLRRIDESVTWQLFQRVRNRTFAMLGGEQSRRVALLQKVLRLLGRALAHGRPGGEAGNSVDDPAPRSDRSRIEVRHAIPDTSPEKMSRSPEPADTSYDTR